MLVNEWITKVFVEQPWQHQVCLIFSLKKVAINYYWWGQFWTTSAPCAPCAPCFSIYALHTVNRNQNWSSSSKNAVFSKPLFINTRTFVHYTGRFLAPAKKFRFRPRQFLPLEQKKGHLCCFRPFFLCV